MDLNQAFKSKILSEIRVGNEVVKSSESIKFL